MQLIEFRVEGFRSLARVGPIRVGLPTVLVGHNDAGKSACLAALQFLLGQGTLRDADRTLVVGEVDRQEQPDRVDQTWVEGTFELSAEEQVELSMGGTVRIRRISRGPVIEARYELLQMVCEDPRFRSLDSMKLGELVDLADAQGLDCPGDRRKRDTFTVPLVALAGTLPQVEEWSPTARDVVRALPQVLAFGSANTADPESQVRAALSAAYQRLLDRTEIKGTVETLEIELRESLAAEAKALCEHIESRCADLDSIVAVPSVSFKGGFSGVELRASSGDNEFVGLREAGTGRTQRITLAVWEWTSRLVESVPEFESRDTLVIYDEPDTHLDYAKQRDFLDLVQSQCATPGVRMIMATHSLNLIDRVDFDQVVSLRLHENRTSVEQLLDASHEGIDRFLIDISESIGLRNSVLLNERCFLVVEGETERLCFPRLFRLHKGLPLQSVGIALMACGGNEGALRVAEFLIKHGRSVFFLLDRDSAENPQTKKLFSKDKLDSFGIPETSRLYVGAPNELEEMFTDEQWAATARMFWPRVDGVDWTSAHIKTERAKEKFSSALLTLFREGSEMGPTGKPHMMMKLVQTLGGPADIPAELGARFDDVESGA